MTPDPTVLSAEAPPVRQAAAALAIRWEALRPAAAVNAGLERSALVVRIDPDEGGGDEDGNGDAHAHRNADADTEPTDGVPARGLLSAWIDAGAGTTTIEHRRRVDLRTVRTDGGVHADVVNGTDEVLLALSLATDGRLLFARTPLLERAGFGPGATLPPVLEG